MGGSLGRNYQLQRNGAYQQQRRDPQGAPHGLLELREALYAFARQVNVNHFDRQNLDGNYTHAPRDLAECLTICKWLQGVTMPTYSGLVTSILRHRWHMTGRIVGIGATPAGVLVLGRHRGAMVIYGTQMETCGRLPQETGGRLQEPLIRMSAGAEYKKKYARSLCSSPFPLSR